MSDDPNHVYLADQAQRLGGTVLDFGCGKGHTVAILRERGVNAYGADPFWGGMTWGDVEPFTTLIAEGHLRQIVDGQLAFPNAMFDTIVSDQVFEHVVDFEESVAEMIRVLKPGGRMYHQFPTKNILLEPHTKVPLAHRLPPRIRRPWLRAHKTVGLGRHPLHIDDPREWAAWGTNWLDEYCSYRSRRTIESEFERHGYRVAHREAQNCLWRARGKPLVHRAVSTSPRLAAAMFRAVGCDCIDLTPVGPVAERVAPS